jgi:hypothetical protein
MSKLKKYWRWISNIIYLYLFQCYENALENYAWYEYHEMLHGEMPKNSYFHARKELALSWAKFLLEVINSLYNPVK